MNTIIYRGAVYRLAEFSYPPSFTSDQVDVVEGINAAVSAVFGDEVSDSEAELIGRLITEGNNPDFFFPLPVTTQGGEEMMIRVMFFYDAVAPNLVTFDMIVGGEVEEGMGREYRPSRLKDVAYQWTVNALEGYF